jgi:hypothetical protein
MARGAAKRICAMKGLCPTTRPQRERRQDANLVRRVDLRADCYRQERASFAGLALHIATDFVGVGFRENPDFMRPAARSPHNRNAAPR